MSILHLRTQRLGHTQLDLNSFQDYLGGIEKTQFAGSKYDLFHHNCNNFSHEVSALIAFNNDKFIHYRKYNLLDGHFSTSMHIKHGYL